MLLIGWSKFSANQKHYPDLGSDTSLEGDFWRHFAENRWGLCNVGCFLRLKKELKLPIEENFIKLNI